MLYYLTVTTGLFMENEEKERLSLILQDRDGGRSASTEDRLHGSRSSVDARRLFLLLVITRYTHADSISTNSNAYLPIVYRSFSRTLTVGISHTYAESCVRALLLSHRHAVMITRGYVKPARGWVVPVCVQNLLRICCGIPERRIPERKFVASDTSHVA